MESTRDIRRLIEREIKKGSAPLTFDHIDYRADALHEIQTESDTSVSVHITAMKDITEQVIPKVLRAMKYLRSQG